MQLTQRGAQKLCFALAFPVILIPFWVWAQTPSTYTNSIGIEFVLIPAGTFKMGSEDGDKDEQPVHTVTISKPFYLGKYEVTQAQWQAIMNNNPSLFQGDANRPVEQVWFNDVQEFRNRLTNNLELINWQLWANPWTSVRDMQQDNAPLDDHPGEQTHCEIADKIITVLEKINN